MSKKLMLVFLLLLILAALGQAETMTIRANELFGEGQLYYLRAGRYFAGYSPAWGQWLMYGRLDAGGTELDCRLQKLSVEGAADAALVTCFARFQRPDRFRGWIDFRGQRRPFCGGANDNLPARCFGE